MDFFGIRKFLNYGNTSRRIIWLWAETNREYYNVKRGGLHPFREHLHRNMLTHNSHRIDNIVDCRISFCYISGKSILFLHGACDSWNLLWTSFAHLYHSLDSDARTKATRNRWTAPLQSEATVLYIHRWSRRYVLFFFATNACMTDARAADETNRQKIFSKRKQQQRMGWTI